MREQVLTAANQAIFHLQFNTNEAVRYVVKEAGVSPKEAGQALKQVMTGYKQSKN